MKEKSNGQTYLENVELWCAIIPNKLVEMQQWYDIATKINASMEGECVQSSGSKQKMADAANKCMDIADSLLDEVERLEARKKEAIRIIESVDNATWYKLLHLRYIQYVPLEDIADMWGVPYTNVTTAHGRAVKEVGRILREKNTFARAE